MAEPRTTRTTGERESELRMAMRHVQTGRRGVMRQKNLIASLGRKGLPTEDAETVLQWLERAQRGFEDHYKKTLADGLARIERATALDLPPEPFG